MFYNPKALLTGALLATAAVGQTTTSAATEPTTLSTVAGKPFPGMHPPSTEAQPRETLEARDLPISRPTFRPDPPHNTVWNATTLLTVATPASESSTTPGPLDFPGVPIIGKPPPSFWSALHAHWSREDEVSAHATEAATLEERGYPHPHPTHWDVEPRPPFPGGRPPYWLRASHHNATKTASSTASAEDDMDRSDDKSVPTKRGFNATGVVAFIAPIESAVKELDMASRLEDMRDHFTAFETAASSSPSETQELITIGLSTNMPIPTAQHEKRNIDATDSFPIFPASSEASQNVYTIAGSTNMPQPIITGMPARRAEPSGLPSGCMSVALSRNGHKAKRDVTLDITPPSSWSDWTT